MYDLKRTFANRLVGAPLSFCLVSSDRSTNALFVRGRREAVEFRTGVRRDAANLERGDAHARVRVGGADRGTEVRDI